MTATKLAIGIVGFQEAETLQATVESVRRIASDIYLLDTGSDDGTRELAESLGVTVIDFEWQHDISHAKNTLIETVEATGQFDWLLCLNGGEVFDPHYRQAFRFFCETQLTPGHVFMLTTLRYPLKGTETLEAVMSGRLHRNSDRDEEIAEARLLPLHRGLRYDGLVREMLVCTDSEAVINVGGAPGVIASVTTYHQPPDRREARVRRNINLVSEARAAGMPIVDELLILHAETLYEMGDYHVARDCYRQVILQSAKNNLRLEAYYRAAELFELTGMSADDTVTFLLTALDDFPLDQQLLLLLGVQLQRQKQLMLAVRAFESATQYGKIAFDVPHRRTIAEQAAIALSIAHQIAGDIDAAIRVVEDKASVLLHRESLTDRLFDLYFIADRVADAFVLASSLWAGEELIQMHDVVSGACVASVGGWESALSPLAKAYRSGSRHPLCLRWYSLTLLALMRFGDAIPILDEWMAVEPDNVSARAFRFAASEPETFAETLQQIQKSQLMMLGIDSPEVIAAPPRGDDVDTLLDSLLSSGVPLHRDALAEFTEHSATSHDVCDTCDDTALAIA